VALGAAVALAADLLEDLDLLTLAGLDQGADHLGALHRGRAQGDLAAVAQQQDLAESDVAAGLAVELFHHEQIARLDLVLFAAGADYRVHDTPWVK
jgi:hypothetical protein